MADSTHIPSVPDIVIAISTVVGAFLAGIAATFRRLRGTPGEVETGHQCPRAADTDRLTRAVFGEIDAGHKGLVQRVDEANAKLDEALALLRNGGPNAGP